MNADASLDARALLCPLPVLKARKALLQMEPGSVLELWATDPAAIVDVPHFCHEAGHSLISMHEKDGAQCYVICRGPDQPA